MRVKYKPKNLLLTSAAMASMRETAFGNASYFATKDILEHAELMRDDEGLIKKAEEKRTRKLAKNKNRKVDTWCPSCHAYTTPLPKPAEGTCPLCFNHLLSIHK